MPNTWSCLPLPFYASDKPHIATQKICWITLLLYCYFFEKVVFFTSMTFFVFNPSFFFINSDGFSVSTDSGYWPHFLLCCFLIVIGPLQIKWKNTIFISLEGNKHRYHKIDHKGIFFYVWWIHHVTCFNCTLIQIGKVAEKSVISVSHYWSVRHFCSEFLVF